MFKKLPKAQINASNLLRNRFKKSAPFFRSLFLFIIGIGFFISVWSILANILVRQPDYEQFTGFLPTSTFKALIDLLQDKEAWWSMGASLRRISIGIGLSFLIGMPAGLLIGYIKLVRQLTYPSVHFLRMVSPLAWMPIALLLFTSFESAIYFIITMASVWPILINSALGVSKADPKWLLMALNQGAKGYQLILYILLPASIPYILSGLRLALGVAWIVIVPAEFLGVTNGLGYLINDARDTLEYDRLMAIIVAIGCIGVILDGAIFSLQQRLSWKRLGDH